RTIEDNGLDLSSLEITTCLRRGEIEIATTFEEEGRDLYGRFENAIVERHSDVLFSLDERTIDQIAAELLAGRTIATGESCTGGLLAARLADQPGASDYLLGGTVAYSNRAKTEQLGVPAELIDQEGAVSEPVALALAEGARGRFGAEIGVGITGIAGPGGGTEAKPVGLVWFAVSTDSGNVSRSIQVPGARADVRERATTIALHMIRRVLSGEPDFLS
ncbi:MAG: nicotinamide-nucleotide amidohydrolase family protein, partial [Actinomycetes bacterium]